MKLFALVLSYLLCHTSARALDDAAASKQKTLTYTATSFVTETATVTGNSTVFTTAIFTRPYPSPVYHNIYTGTTTSTYTETTTTHTTIQPKSTTSVGTRKGFTPILSESVYTDRIVIERTTVTTTTTSTYDPSPTTTLGDFRQVYNGTTDITTTTVSVVYSKTVVTQTSTAKPAVHTNYAACRPNNLASRIPTGQLLNIVGQGADTGGKIFYTDNAADCCGFCQRTKGCFGGSWSVKPDRGTCLVATINPTNASETCDGSRGDYGIFGADPEYDGTTPGISKYEQVAFNGPCGQLSWFFYGGDYFK